MTLTERPNGQYRFLQGIDPYSCGVIANPGYEIVHVTISSGLPWRDGFSRIDSYLRLRNLRRTSLCGMQLLCPQSYSFDGFQQFNNQYCSFIDDWGLYMGRVNPLARTNVAPAISPYNEPELHAFSHVTPEAKSPCDKDATRAGNPANSAIPSDRFPPSLKPSPADGSRELPICG